MDMRRVDEIQPVADSIDVEERRSVLEPGLLRTLVAYFLLMALVPVIAVGVFSYLQARDGLRVLSVGALEATSAQRELFIQNWFDYRFRDLDAQARAAGNVRLLASLQQAHSDSGKPIGKFVGSYGWATLVDGATDDLDAFRRIYDYHDVFLIDINGNILYTSIAESDLGTNLFDGPYSGTLFSEACKRALAGDRATFSDLELYAPSDNSVAGFLVSPMSDDHGQMIGLMALQIRTDSIDRMMQLSAGQASGRESYLVGTDGVLRSNRAGISKTTALHDTIDTEQTRAWLRTHADGGDAATTVHSASIYDGPADEPVVGLHRDIQIADVSWALISEIEERNAFAASSRLLNVIRLLIVAVAVIVLLFSVTLASRLSRPIRRLAAAADSVAGGDLNQNLDPYGENEIGAMTRSFNSMVDGLRESSERQASEDWIMGGRYLVSDAIRGVRDANIIG